MRSDEILISTASTADAEAISHLYRTTYGAGHELFSETGYPYPQFMEPGWIAATIRARRFCWLVARSRHASVGCLGALVSVDAPKPPGNIVEFAGLVVDSAFRRRGIGEALLASMCTTLRTTTSIMLAEVRTRNLGGWKGTTNVGFHPIGFRPFAHKMLGTSEGMFMMAYVSADCLAERRVPYSTSPSVERLASECLSNFGEPALSANSPSFQQHAKWKNAIPPLIATGVPAVTFAEISAHSVWSAERSIEDANLVEYVASVERLWSLNDSSARFRVRRFAASRDGILVGSLTMAIDMYDCRARIVELRLAEAALCEAVLDNLVHSLQGETGTGACETIDIDVRADTIAIQVCFVNCGFIPTVYYPALFAAPEGRIDGVQFTRFNFPFTPESVRITSGIDARSAGVMDAVLHLSHPH